MNQRRNVAIAIGVLAVLAVAGFGVVRLVSANSASTAVVARTKATTCADTYKVLNLRPSQVTAASAACLVQSLQLSGELTGIVGQAFSVDADEPAPTQMCSVPKRWDGFPQARLAFVAGKKAYRLRISPPGASQHQAVTLNNIAGIVELASMAGPGADWNQASGTVKVNADGISGTIDANLLRDVSGARPVHVTGQWACGAHALPAFDSTAPCSRFYALNHLHEMDIARMKAQACNSVDLTFSGDVSGHLDHAVTDTAIKSDALEGDNLCAVVGDQFSASLKFSIGDESFLLKVQATNYPTVVPGQYTADKTSGSTYAQLWFGYADPERNGRFVSDLKIFWWGSVGSFTIAGDMKSGTIDETLEGLGALNSNGTIQGSTVHLSGSWRCAA